MDRRKLNFGALPVDCVFEIVRYVHSTTTFFKIYSLSKGVKWIFDEEYSTSACEFIKFETNKNMENNNGLVKSIKNYVVQLKMWNEISLSLFPNVKSLEILFFPEEQKDFFSYLPNLNYLEKVIINHMEGCTIPNSFLVYFSKLKYVELSTHVDYFDGDKNDPITDDGLKHLVNVETLIMGEGDGKWGIVKGECFKYMTKLHTLVLNKVKGHNGDFFKYLGHVKKICLRYIYRGEMCDSDLEPLKNGKLNRFEIYRSYHSLTPICFQYLPDGLKEIKIDRMNRGIRLGQDYELIRALSRFKNLESIIGPGMIDHFDYKLFPNLKKIETMSENGVILFFRNIHTVTINVEELTLRSQPFFTSGVTDDNLLLLAKFKNLKVLRITNGEGITRRGLLTIRKNHRKLDLFELWFNSKITRDDFELVRAKKRIVHECDKITRDPIPSKKKKKKLANGGKKKKKSKRKERSCKNCGDKGFGFKRCSGCHIRVYYCSRECQVKHWKVHKKVCGKQ